MSRRLTVGPFNRVEGDLEVTLDIADGHIASARVNASLYRGFEQILSGKHPLDALVIVPRICGICSVSQSATAAAALADATGLVMPPNGRLAQNLILACENVADHLTHFYLFFMPDFAREAYRGRVWHAATEKRFKATVGDALKTMLPARADFLRVMGYLAGKWPHSLALQPGGTTRAITPTEMVRLLSVLREFRAFLETTLFGDVLENVAALADPAALAAWADGRQSDFARFLHIADDLALAGMGRATDVFLSHGAYGAGDEHLFAQGVWDANVDGALASFDQTKVREDVTHAWLLDDAPLHPLHGETRPLLGEFGEKADAYSWCKAPRYGGSVVETGALARQVVAGHPLLRSLVAADGGNVKARVVARLLEIALLVPAMENWVRALVPGDSFCNQWELPESASGIGLVEAARGALGHWLRIERGKIASYQIIAPTTWNFSPRDAAGSPGALEQALVGLPVGESETAPLAVQHVVRSFDPCMVCTVH
jgi:hydrogenase large subunit